MKCCNFCEYSTKDSSNFKRHNRAKHSKSTISAYEEDSDIKSDLKSRLPMPLSSESFGNSKKYVGGLVDVRLEENFKLFVSGPSRCGKTVFVSNLIENIGLIAKKPPTFVIYVYKVWQDKYDEMESLGVNFIQDNINVVNEIKGAAQGKPILVI